MGIQDFIAISRVNGIAKANRFTVYFQAPPTLANAGPFTPFALQNIALYCNRAELPSMSVSTTGIRTTGEMRNVAYDRNFDDCSVSFYADAGMNARYFFEEWINSIQDRDTRNFAYYDDYTIAKMVIDVESVNNDPTYRVEMYDVFPKQVGSVNLDYAANGLMEISVVFEYRYAKSYQLTEGGVPTAYSADHQGFFGATTSDPFISIQGGLSLALGKKGFQGLAAGITLNSGSSVLSPLVLNVQGSFNSLSNSITGLGNIIPSSMSDSGNSSLIASMSLQASRYSSTTANMGIQLATPGGLNISASGLTTIGGQLQTVNSSMSPTSTIGLSVSSFSPTSTGAITAQLTTMGTQLNSIGGQLAVASGSVNTGILAAVNGNVGVALNGPRG